MASGPGAIPVTRVSSRISTPAERQRRSRVRRVRAAAITPAVRSHSAPAAPSKRKPGNRLAASDGASRSTSSGKAAMASASRRRAPPPGREDAAVAVDQGLFRRALQPGPLLGVGDPHEVCVHRARIGVRVTRAAPWELPKRWPGRKRSSTAIRPAPRRASCQAAARPFRPPPTTRTSRVRPPAPSTSPSPRGRGSHPERDSTPQEEDALRIRILQHCLVVLVPDLERAPVAFPWPGATVPGSGARRRAGKAGAAESCPARGS